MPLDNLEDLYFPHGGKDAAAFSRASTFEPLIDGDAYFAAVRAAIDTLGRPGRVLHRGLVAE